MQIWRVNTRTQTLTREPTPESWAHLGGRGLIARILVDEVPGTCDPLGPQNKLIFAPGLLVGHMLSSCDRISVGSKSPLTGGIKEANAGGQPSQMLARLGYAAVILEGKPNREAYLLSGYKATTIKTQDCGASEILRDPKVQAYIQAQRKKMEEKTMVTREYVLKGLMEVHQKASQNVPILDKKGRPTGEYRFDSGGANKALELLGKTKAMFVDKKEENLTVDIPALQALFEKTEI